MTFDTLLTRAKLLRQDVGRLPDDSVRYRHHKISACAAQLYLAHVKQGTSGFGPITTSSGRPLDELTEDLVEMGRRYLSFWKSLVDIYCPFYDVRQISIFREGKTPISPEPWPEPGEGENQRDKGDVIGYGAEILTGDVTLQDELDNTICTLEVLVKRDAPDLRLSPTLAFSPQERTDDKSGTSRRRLASSADDSADARRLELPDRTEQKDTAAWKRLRIRCEKSGNNIAHLDGREYRMTEGGTLFLKALKEARGRMVKAKTLSDSCGDRADRIHGKLPPELQSIIDPPGKGRQGYGML